MRFTGFLLELLSIEIVIPLEGIDFLNVHPVGHDPPLLCRYCTYRLLPTSSVAGDKLRLTTFSMIQCRRDSLEVLGKSTITGRYQLTLPKHVREFLKADNGDLVVFIKDHDKIVVKRGTVKIED
jgi:AbrB family looped-hinge helix DNA binding protein